MKVLVVISLLVVFSLEKGLGYPEGEDVPGDETAEKEKPPDEAKDFDDDDSETEPVHPRAHRRHGHPRDRHLLSSSLVFAASEPTMKEFECFNCESGLRNGKNVPCEKGDIVGMRLAGPTVRCTTNLTKANVDNWRMKNRCVIIKGDGWTHRSCLNSEVFLQKFRTAEWKATKSIKKTGNDTVDKENKTNAEFDLFKKNMKIFSMTKCNPFGKYKQFCSCSTDMCNTAPYATHPLHWASLIILTLFGSIVKILQV